MELIWFKLVNRQDLFLQHGFLNAYNLMLFAQHGELVQYLHTGYKIFKNLKFRNLMSRIPFLNYVLCRPDSRFSGANLDTFSYIGAYSLSNIMSRFKLILELHCDRKSEHFLRLKFHI